MSGRKIVGSATEGLISILYCQSPWVVSQSPQPRSEEWLQGGEGAEMEERLQRARRGTWKVKEDSFTKTGAVLRVRVGGRMGGCCHCEIRQCEGVQVQWQTVVFLMTR